MYSRTYLPVQGSFKSLLRSGDQNKPPVSCTFPPHSPGPNLQPREPTVAHGPWAIVAVAAMTQGPFSRHEQAVDGGKCQCLPTCRPTNGFAYEGITPSRWGPPWVIFNAWSHFTEMLLLLVVIRYFFLYSLISHMTVECIYIYFFQVLI